jgi:hypothetical protein
MSTIMPKGENIRRAVKWISEEKQDAPDANLKKLVQEASRKFNLTPRVLGIPHEFLQGSHLILDFRKTR